jgi:hypothetical protein
MWKRERIENLWISKFLPIVYTPEPKNRKIFQNREGQQKRRTRISWPKPQRIMYPCRQICQIHFSQKSLLLGAHVCAH